MSSKFSYRAMNQTIYFYRFGLVLLLGTVTFAVVRPRLHLGFMRLREQLVTVKLFRPPSFY